MSVYLDTLINEVLALSESNIWEIAVKEWKIADCEEDLSRSSDCICGKENLRYLFMREQALQLLKQPLLLYLKEIDGEILIDSEILEVAKGEVLVAIETVRINYPEIFV